MVASFSATVLVSLIYLLVRVDGFSSGSRSIARTPIYTKANMDEQIPEYSNEINIFSRFKMRTRELGLDTISSMEDESRDNDRYDAEEKLKQRGIIVGSIYMLASATVAVFVLTFFLSDGMLFTPSESPIRAAKYVSVDAEALLQSDFSNDGTSIIF